MSDTRPAVPTGPIITLVYRVAPERRAELLAFLRDSFPLYERPGGIRMAMYESMAIDLDTLDFSAPVLESGRHAVEIDGKRGSAQLSFHLLEGDRVVGHGRKRILLSGLRPYDADAMAAAIEDYNARKQSFTAG